MRKTLEVLNRLKENKVITDYAIGGAMGALFYTEPMSTMDLDIFVLFSDDLNFLPLAPIYSQLKEWGYGVDVNESECVNIEGTPVQFLPAYDDLLKEALAYAREFDYNGVKTKVMLAEYLAVICVKTGRIKDKFRLNMFLSSDGFNRLKFEELLRKFKLYERFETWKVQYQ